MRGSSRRGGSVVVTRGGVRGRVCTGRSGRLTPGMSRGRYGGEQGEARPRPRAPPLVARGRIAAAAKRGRGRCSSRAASSDRAWRRRLQTAAAATRCIGHDGGGGLISGATAGQPHVHRHNRPPSRPPRCRTASAAPPLRQRLSLRPRGQGAERDSTPVSQPPAGMSRAATCASDARRHPRHDAGIRPRRPRPVPVAPAAHHCYRLRSAEVGTAVAGRACGRSTDTAARAADAHGRAPTAPALRGGASRDFTTFSGGWSRWQSSLDHYIRSVAVTFSVTAFFAASRVAPAPSALTNLAGFWVGPFEKSPKRLSIRQFRK